MTRLFRSTASCLATLLLAAACTGSDPLSPTSDRLPAANAALAKTTKKAGDTAARVDTATTLTAPTVQSATCQLGSDSTATPSDSTGGNCLGDTIPWGRSGDTLPWGK